MSNLKYKLLLCVVAVMLLSVPLYAAQVEVWSWNFDGAGPDAAKDWTFSAGSDWAVGPPAEAAVNGPAAAVSAPNVLATNLSGNYANGLASPEFAVSPKIDCTDQVGVTLSFKRWLRVEAGAADKAYIQVSGDAGATWSDPIWENPEGEWSASLGDFTGDLLDTGWSTVTYDISEVADGQEEVQIRWALSSDGSTAFDGWNIDDIVVSASAPDAVIDWGDAAGWTRGTGWDVGAATVGGGQSEDDDSNPATPNVMVGQDPGTDAAGVAGGTIVGYRIGANYEASLPASYLTSPLFDCSGLVGTAIRFDRYLEVGDGAFDKATIQVHVDPDPDTPGIDSEEFFSDETAVVLNAGTKTHVWEVNTSEFFENDFTVKYVLGTLPSGHNFTILYCKTNSSTASDWTLLTTDNTATPADATESVTSPTPLPVAFSDGKIFIKAALDLDSGDSGSVTIKKVTAEGVSWKYVWQNPAASPLTRTLDKKWTEQFVSLDADGAEEVAVRFAMGPTDAFAASKYGGWSLDNMALVEGSREFRSAGIEAAGALKWEATDDITVSLQNTGTGTWDSQHAAYEVLARTNEVDDPGNPGEKMDVRVNQDLAINRWGVGDIAVGDDDTVAPDDIYAFAATITAPPLSSIVYKTPVGVTAPPDAGLSALGSDWALGDEIGGDLVFAPSFMDEGPASKGIVVTRFPDDQPPATDTNGEWARPWIEELAGGVPFVVQGYPSGKYEPKVVVDRASIAVYIQRAANVPSAPDVQVFHDVPPDQWAYSQINAVFNAGIIIGFADATYHPDAIVTRDAMCKFIVNGVNAPSFHPGAITVPTMDSLNTQAAQDAYPFGDVDCFNNTEDPGPQVDERNPLANFILAAANADIVQGYPVPAGSPDGTKPKFHPEFTIMRDQLAVFVWRGFMRDFPSYVALGGPDITQAIVADDLTPTGPAGGLAPYSGLSMLRDVIQNDEDATAYVTLDAVRLNQAGGADDVVATFALTGGALLPAVQTVTIPGSAVDGVLADILSTDPNADTDGEPYMTVACPLAVPDHGTYKLVTTVNGVELSRKPTLRVMGQMFLEDMNSGNFQVGHAWNITGQPAPPLDFYGTGADAADETNGDLKMGAASLQLQGTQAIQIIISTLNRHDIRLSMNLAGVDFADADAITVSWSKDAGAHWIEGFTVDGTEIAAKLKDGKMSIDLPNGLKWTNPTAWAALTPTQQADLVNWGADDNSNFAVKIAIVGSTDARGYVDNVELRGT